MTVKKRHKKALSYGRPPSARPKERMTAERSRSIIRTHHRLQKELAAALKNGDLQAAAVLSQAIEEYGGIKTYQAASKQGQAKDRGGDSSKVLVDWLVQAQVLDSTTRGRKSSGEPLLKCLEVGALSTKNEISRFPSVIKMHRIDLNSQGPGIEKQDFMERPLPSNQDERFDLISLSLVLNYVPDAVARGEMLKRITKFLRIPGTHTNLSAPVLPALFFVLPLPCMENSRYFGEDLLLRIMESLGFSIKFKKHTSKLCYYLFTLTDGATPTKFPKKKIKDKPTMNNFAIVLE